ncbi:hypothetical protein RF11_03044 [Thelohanellus kitauei]|uniref:Uncharacterized protein n=1 Tax=Thelohanellus kitauei TaxID=669202 RepID=A0A0C2ITS6_THEKT|nr:hypothetical protein RF11_03044 [Thelohanellus kitauei]
MAIQDCFIFGHKFGTVYHDEEKQEAFYKRGDEIREQHRKSHTCAKTSFNLSEYEDNIQKAFKDYDKFNINKDLPVFGEITYTCTWLLTLAACRKCIDVYGHLCEFLKDKQREVVAP